MRALFFGTPDIAVPSLEALTTIADVVGVVCQPDRPAGRGLALSAPKVKERALALGLEVVQPEKVRTPEVARWIASREADVAVVIAYGRILPPALLAAPRLGCLNLHASILPKYRGAAPIQWAIVRGETETGISLMQMDEGMDTGPVYSVSRLPIGPDETAGELAVRLGELAARVVVDDVPRVVRGELVATPQKASDATLAPMLDRDAGVIDWTLPAIRIHDLVRGMAPWPAATTRVAGKALKVLETRRLDGAVASGDAPGTVMVADKSGVVVATGRGTIEIVRAQLEGKKALAARELVQGRALAPGQVLGA